MKVERAGWTLALAVAGMAMAAPIAAQQHQHGQQNRQGQHQGGMQGERRGMETPWRELNGFHSLLHLSHHPLMQSNDLAPARRNAGLLADAAEAWAASTAPAECSGVDQEQVKALATEARAYAALVDAQGSDDDVKAALGRIHDRFETLHKACMPKGHKGH